MNHMLRVIRDIDHEYKNITQILTDLEEYYQVKLSPRQKHLYAKDLVDMGSDNVSQAASRYRSGWTNSKFPMPNQLMKEIGFIHPDRS